MTVVGGGGGGGRVYMMVVADLVMVVVSDGSRRIMRGHWVLESMVNPFFTSIDNP